MSDKRLLLAVKFDAVDKLSGALRNIMAGGKEGAQSLKELRAESTKLGKQLKDVRKEILSGMGNGSQLSGLISRERELTSQIARANEKFDEQKRKIERVASIRSRASAVADRAGAIGGAASLAVTAPVIGFAVTAINASRDASAAMAQTKASIESMGNAAGRTFPQLQAQAGNLMKSSLYDDDEILRKVTANMLTFGKVSGTTFDRAQLAAVNLSTKMEGDLKGSTIMIGKALNDPVKGLTALNKVGIGFTDAQKEMAKSMVETGNVAGAQAIILNELDKQFGGSAKAARNADPIAAAALDFGEFQQAVGDKLLPQLLPLVTALSGLMESFNNLSPETQKFLIIAVGAAAAFGPLVAGIGGIAAGIAALAPVLAGAGAGIAMFLGVWLPLGIAIGYVGYLIYSNWDTIKAAFIGGFEAIKGAVTTGWAFVTNAFNTGIAFITGLGSRFLTLGQNIMQGLVNGIKAGANWVKDMILGLAGNITGWFKNALGIKSPSRIFMGMGGHITDGLALGLDRGAKSPLRSMARITAGVSGAAALGFAAPAMAGQVGQAVSAMPAAAGMTVNNTIHIHVSGADAADPRALAVAIKRELDALLAVDARGSYADA